MPEMEIKRWHVYLADLNPRFGTEPGKSRPVLVIQTDLLNAADHPSTIICPLTTQLNPKAKWLRIHLDADEAGLHTPSDILVDQIRAIDNRRFMKKLGLIFKEHQRQLMRSLKAVLDL